jgi:hypothetical protein
LDYQQKKLADEKLSCGGAVLCGAFAELQARLATPKMPYVWATIKTDNDRSARRLHRHGFDELASRVPGAIVVLRKPGLDPFETRDCGWSFAI